MSNKENMGELLRDNGSISILEGGKHLKRGRKLIFHARSRKANLPIKTFKIAVKG